MYTSPDDARSDLFLAAVAFIFGRLLLQVTLQIIPLGAIPGVATVLSLLAPVAVTLLVPILLIRYRQESLASYSWPGPSTALASGAVLGLPMVAASLLATVVPGAGLAAALPIVALGPQALLSLVVRILTWVGMAGLAVYVAVKARDAFRGDYQTVRDAMLEIGRWVGIVLAVSTLLLVISRAATLGLGTILWLIAAPLAMAAAFGLAMRSVPARVTTTRATLLTPTVVLALGSRFLSFDPAQLVAGLWQASLYAAIGLLIGVLIEAGRNAMAAVGFALVLATLTVLAPVTIV